VSVQLVEVMLLGTSDNTRLLDRLAGDLSRFEIRAFTSPLGWDRPFEHEMASSSSADILVWTRAAAGSEGLVESVEVARKLAPVIIGVSDSVDLSPYIQGLDEIEQKAHPQGCTFQSLVKLVSWIDVGPPGLSRISALSVVSPADGQQVALVDGQRSRPRYATLGRAFGANAALRLVDLADVIGTLGPLDRRTGRPSEYAGLHPDRCLPGLDPVIAFHRSGAPASPSAADQAPGTTCPTGSRAATPAPSDRWEFPGTSPTPSTRPSPAATPSTVGCSPDPKGVPCRAATSPTPTGADPRPCSRHRTGPAPPSSAPDLND
jgi:hypothetical protein